MAYTPNFALTVNGSAPNQNTTDVILNNLVNQALAALYAAVGQDIAAEATARGDADTLRNQYSTRIYPDRATAVADIANLVPGQTTRIATVEGTALCVRAPFQGGDDPLSASSPYWGVVLRLDVATLAAEVRDGRVYTIAGSTSPSGMSIPAGYSADLVCCRKNSNARAAWWGTIAAPGDGLETASLARDANGNWWIALTDDVAAAAIAGVQTALNAEATARATADTSLSQAIANEASARTTADNALSQAISGEATARTAADDALRTEMRNGRMWASAGGKTPSGMAIPPDYSIDLLTITNNAEGTSSTWRPRAAPADGLETDRIKKDAGNGWWEVMPDAAVGVEAAARAAADAAMASAIESSGDRLTMIEATVGAVTDIIGPSSVYAATSAIAADNIYPFDAVIQRSGTLTSVDVYVMATGTITVYEMTRDGLQFSILGGRVLTATEVGINRFDLDMPVSAGSLIGICGRHVVGYTSGGGIPFWTVSPSTLRDSDGATDTSVQIQAKYTLIAPTDGSILARLDTIDAASAPKKEPLPAYRFARADMAINASTVRILCIGDSNTMGWSNAGVGVNRRARSYPTYLSKILSDSVPSRADNVFGRSIINNNTGQYTTYNPQIAFSGGFGIGGNPSLGGEMFMCATANGTLTFTPTGAWDRAEVFFAQSVDGVAEVSSGGYVNNYTPTVGQIVRAEFVLGAEASLPLIVKCLSGTINIIGINVWSSTNPCICVLNAGRSSWTAGDYANGDAFYSPINAIESIGADLVIIELGLNDANTSVSPATYEANMRSLIEKVIASESDVAILTSFQPNLANWSTYLDIQRGLASEYSIACFDASARFGPYSDAMAHGFVANDLHLSAHGLYDKARMIAARL